MKSHVLIAFGLSLVACEGEPPKTAAGTISEAPPPASSEAVVAEPETHAACSTCTCTCAPGDAGVVAANASDAATTSDAAVVAETADAAPAAHGDIVGKITATPAYLASAAVVYLEDAPKDPTRGMHARIDNHQMTFSPMVQVITVGGTVTFVNSDPFPHNVFSPDNDKFNMGSIPQNSSSGPRKFDKAGAYTLLCNLHPGMLGYLVVSPSSYFARTDGRGHYHIKDVPPGTYKVTAWAPRLPTVTQSVTVSAAEATSDFELHR